MQARSPSGASGSSRGSMALSTGTDSPVSAASATCSRDACDRAKVGRHDPSGFQQHEVADHHVCARDGRRGAVAHDARPRGRHGPQSLDGLLGAVPLDDADGGVQHDDHQDRDRVDGVADDAGDHCRGEQQEDHHVLELLDHHVPEAATGLLGQLVRAVGDQSIAGLVPGQPGGRVAAHLGRRRRRRSRCARQGRCRRSRSRSTRRSSPPSLPCPEVPRGESDDPMGADIRWRRPSSPPTVRDRGADGGEPAHRRARHRSGVARRPRWGRGHGGRRLDGGGTDSSRGARR